MFQSTIEATVASFRNLPTTIPIKNSVVIFWESHTKNPDDKNKTQATIDLISKKFDLSSCEKYEIRTGYLSRYNYLTKPKRECSIEEIEEAVIKGEAEQTEWIKRVEPKLEDFVQVNWQECVNKVKNPHFVKCRELLMKTINENESFYKAYKESAEAYSVKRNANEENSFSYLVEENAWILTIPLQYPNKQIYIIHVGNVTDSTTILFSTFDYLRESARLLFPYFQNQKFADVSDFRIEYNEKRNRGYFVCDDNLVNVVANVKKEQDLDKKDLLRLLVEERAEKELLSNIIAKMPGHVYWLNSKGVYLGCNDIQAKHLGLNSRDEIVGKTVFDLLPPLDAKKHNNINKLVIEKGKTYSGEEKSSMHNGFRTYLSHKNPLINNSGKTIGLLGISVDVTDRKNAEELRSQNRLQRIELQEREKTKLLAERVAHDIRSPLASLAMITQYCKGLSEKERTLLKSVATNIENITNDLLRKYKTHEDAGTNIDTKAEQYIFVDLSLEDMLASKNYQYKKENIAFNYFQNLTNKFVFIKGNSSDFCRMISNLINNSVESIEGKEGLIDINFNVKDGKVEIKIKDNGKGMSQEMVDNIMKDIVIGTSKEEGYGIGLQQVKSALKSMNSQMLVKSSENMGTEITLVFQESKPPDWFVNNIVLHKDDTVVVLDDDISIHNIWKKRFENYAEDITVKCFTQGLEAIDFMNSIKEKDKIFLLADYELRDQDINGVDVIEKTAMEQQSLLVTNIYISKIKDFNEKCKFIKILPKKYICDISIMIKK